VLDVRDVTVGFGDAPVLDRYSLHVDAGAIIALLGPSGSGKSTLLRVIAGLITPATGTVLVDGEDVTRLPTHLRHVGMVFQDEQLFPHLTVADNVAFGLKMAGVAKVERLHRADELLDVVGLPGFGDRRVDHLSGGEAKRVAVARSLAPSPKVLLLDEPLTGLDRDLHDRLSVEVPAIIRSTSTTAIWVTHDRIEADAVSDRVVRLDPDPSG
jgi:thiamine transport system ATP-binding protein